MAIYIFSRPIHSGKTTALLNFCNQKKNIAGVLMPDVDGSRKIYDLFEKAFFDIQCHDPLAVDEPLTSVGRYHFFTAGFEKANEILFAAIAMKPGWLIIDEAGKLELDRKGLYVAVVKAVEVYSQPDFEGNLLIAVRDSLCDTVVSSFGITHFRTITQLEDIL